MSERVRIYFDQATKAKVLEALAKQMPADGVLNLGAAETVIGIGSALRRWRLNEA